MIQEKTETETSPEPPPLDNRVEFAVSYSDDQGHAFESAFMYVIDEWGQLVNGFGQYPRRSTTIELDAGRYWFIVIKEGYTADIQYIEITKETRELEFVLGSGGSIFGRIIGRSYYLTPVYPLVVWRLLGSPKNLKILDLDQRRMGEALTQGATRDADGFFTLDHLPPGWYVVLTDKEASEPVEVREGHETGPIEFVGETSQADQ